MKNDVFVKYSVPRAVATLAIPTMLSMLITIFYNMADTLFVGKTGDPNQVAAVSLATPVFLIIMAVGNIFGIGGSAFISRSLGEGKEEKVKQISSFCFYGCIGAGIIMMVLFLVGMPVILQLVGAKAETIDFTRDYLTYIAYGAVFVVIANAFGNVVRGEGAAKASMIGMMLGTVVNIILDPIMILAMNMGVAGAAIATIIGNICSTVFYIYYLTRKTQILSISPKHFKAGAGIMGGVFAIGIPACLNNVLMSTSNIILNNFLIEYGNNAVAGMGVAMKANIMVVLLQLGLGMGIQPLVGYAYGAGDHKKLVKITKFAIMCQIIIGTLLTVIYLLFTQQIVETFIDNQEVVDFGVNMLRALMISGPFIGIMFVFSFSFQAMGKAVPALVLSISRQGLVFLPVLIISSKLFGLDGLVFSQPIADIFSLFISLAMFVVISKNMRKRHELSENKSETVEIETV